MSNAGVDQLFKRRRALIPFEDYERLAYAFYRLSEGDDYPTERIWDDLHIHNLVDDNCEWKYDD